MNSSEHTKEKCDVSDESDEEGLGLRSITEAHQVAIERKSLGPGSRAPSLQRRLSQDPNLLIE